MTIDESRWRVGLSLATPVILLFLAWGAVVVDMPTPVPIVLAVLALFLGYIALFDFAISVEVDERGIQRRCLFRRQLTIWDDAAAIVQPRKRGLVLVTNDRKQRVLVDRTLEEGELTRLRAEAERRGLRVDV